MASTIIIYEGDGIRTDFTIPFDYLKKSFVTVRLGTGTTLTGGDYGDTGSDYYFLDKTTIRLKVAPASGEPLTIRRYTSATERVVTFKDASILKATDLDTSQVQAFHIAEEGRDILEDSLSVNREGNWDAKNKRIVNLADPVNPQDALTKAYYDADSQKVQANRDETEKFMERAETAADSAKASEEAAKESADYVKEAADVVVPIAPEIKIVANNITHVQTTSNNIKDVNLVGGDLEGSFGISTFLDYGDLGDTSGTIPTITGGNIKVVADNIEDVRTVAGLADDFQTVINSVETVTSLTTRAETAATTATTKATEASNSATKAASSATAAATSAATAGTSATKAASSATAAATSAATAGTSATNAGASADSAEASATEATTQAERAKEYAEQASAGQIQADWSETDNTAKSFIKNKPSVNTYNVVLAELQEGTKTTFGYVTAAGIRGAIKKWAPTDVDISGKADITYVDEQVATKQDAGDYATTSSLTTGLAGKANVEHSHTIANITNLQTTLDGKQAKGDYATLSNLTTGLATKLDVTAFNAYVDYGDLGDL